ncbi:MAG TPA: DNA primase small subunit domain-containing protein, partial [Candidatus Nanoarchaeia archaeon]|nr:DNA primase small subunit domain-containing protein [Candidatus Nanoarchaeia archaeon]
QDREIAPRYNEGFGRRPDVLQFPGDVLELARKGATSFHISEERWEDPLKLKPGMNKRDLDENRRGWDLCLDIDTPYWDYAKWTAYFLIEALKFHDVKNISVKFSGGKGWHIVIPFESFPDEVNGRKTKDLFPEAPRVITAYLQNMIHEMLTQKILEKENVQNICQRTGKKREEIMMDGKFDPFTLVDIDTVLISSRHLFRSPYSLHEKTGLVSVPIDIKDVLTFDKRDAEPENVRAERKYLDRTKVTEKDAKTLIIQAFDWWGKKHEKKGPDQPLVPGRTFELPTQAITEAYFPDCIQRILGGLDDGKKRAIFILINFLKHMQWPWPDIEAKVKEWNTKNKEHLSETYLLGQLNWHKRQTQTILPPNCTNKAYYQDLRISCNPMICAKFKNPVNCALNRAKNAQNKAPKNKKPYKE